MLALSGMLVLVPLAAPAHATNSSPLIYSVGGLFGSNPITAGPDGFPFELTITNPASNSYAVTAITISTPNSNWYIYDCYTDYSAHFNACTDSSSGYNVEFTASIPLPPGASDIVTASVEAPNPSASLIYPYSGTFTTTVQDQSSSAFYVGPKFSLQVIAISSSLTETVTPGGSNTVTTYTAGTAPYTISAQLTCSTTEPGCTTGYENGVNIEFGQSTYGAHAVYSFSKTNVDTSGSGSTAGTASTVFQPSNIASSSFEIGTGQPWAGVNGCNLNWTCFTTILSSDPQYGAAITTVPAAPSSVGFTSGGNAFGTGSSIYLNNKGSTTNTPVYTGAQLCNNLLLGCAADSQQVAVSVTDRFGNSLAFTSITSPLITFQTASGAVFDASGLPSIISNYSPTATPQPVPDNYYQSSTYGSAGVITATITGTYGGGTFSVSGSSGSILTSTFATTGNFNKTSHASPYSSLPAASVQAGKSETFEVSLGIAQSNVPVTVAICDHGTAGCSATSSGYTGTITTASGVTNSSGEYSTSLQVDTKAGTVAVMNATVWRPTTSSPKATFVIGPSNATTTTAGPAAKFTVIVGIGSNLDPSPITYAIGGSTVYVNVVTSDAYGNPVSTVGSEEVAITLSANPNTLSDANPDIPTNCYETNGTSGNGCTSGYGSFGPIAWTLPASGTGTIYATGVLNGVVITSATVTITIVSKLPSLSITSPAPLKGVIYSDSANTQFRGWANVSQGWNGQATMSSLGWQIGTGSWQHTALAAVQKATWSVVATLPSGLTQVEFNATDSKGDVVVSSPLSVLVDTVAPVVTNVTPNNATLNPGQLFSATVVVDEGDLNATSVQVSVNGTAISSSDVTVTGTNDLGTSVTYTVTAVLPTGDNAVSVSASSLAGLTGSSSSETVHVTVAAGDSIIFTQSEAAYGVVGAYTGITVPVTNLWSTSQNVVIYATFKSGTSTYVAQGTTTLGPGQTINVFAIDLQVIPAGTYTVTFAAVTTSNVPVSAPTTPITVTVA